jgi:hypothetical protein
MLMRGYTRIALLPQITLAVANRDMCVALGFEWLWGTVNIGVPRFVFHKAEIKRKAQILACAQKLGISVRQQELRWNGY